MSNELPGPETTLEHYPWVVIRFRCTRCKRYGDARLARLAEKFGAGETIAALVDRFRTTCPTRPISKSGKRVLSWSELGEEGCGGYCPDLATNPPPDLPPGMRGLRLIDGGKSDLLPAEPAPPARRRRIGGADDI